jgi:uncharacterized protein (DUF3084 family)
MVLSAVAAWWFRGTVAGSKRDGLQAIIHGRDAQLAGKDSQIAAKDSLVAARDVQIAGLNSTVGLMRERIALATEMQKDLTSKLDAATKSVETFRQQLVAKASPENIEAEASSTATFVRDLVSSSNALSRILKTDPGPPEPELYVQYVRSASDEKRTSGKLPSE